MLRRLILPALLVATPAVAQTGIPAGPGTSMPSATPSLAAALGTRETTPVTAIPLDKVVAVVGDKPILMSDALEAVAYRRARGETIPTDSARYMALLHETVDRLVDAEVLVQKAQAEKVDIADAELTPAVDQQVKRIRDTFASDSEYRTALRNEGFASPDDYRRFLSDRMRREQLQQRLIDKLRQDGKLVNVGVTDADVDSMYQQSREKLPTRPATIGFRQIVIAAKASPDADRKARAKADSLLADIHSGSDFEKLAKRESMDPGSRELGGDLGWNRRGHMVKEFDDMMFALQPGQVSPVVKTVFGYHIIRVDRVNPSEVKARHILIQPAVDSNDVARARLQADSVLARWKAGANFDSLAAKYHDTRAGEEKNIPEIDRSLLPASYGAAVAGHKAGDFVGPFAIPDPITKQSKFVIAQITEMKDGGQYTRAEFKNQIRDQLAYEKAYRRLVDQLRKNSYVSVRI